MPFKENDFYLLPKNNCNKICSFCTTGIFDTLANENWKKQRRFAHTTLRGMGFGKVSLEPIIKDEVNHTVSYFKVSW